MIGNQRTAASDNKKTGSTRPEQYAEKELPAPA
jgi:hypothetical protein